MILRWTIATVAIIFTTLASAQEKQPHILLMTGKVLDGKVITRDAQYIEYQYTKKNGKTVEKKLDLERVFSISDASGAENVVYQMDTVIGNFYTVDEMRFFIKGEQDAMAAYHGYWVLLVGYPVTTGLGYLLSETILVIAVPFFYLMAAGVPKFKLNDKCIKDPKLLSNEAYVNGYERLARTRRLFNALGIGVLGTATGLAIGFTKP